MLWDVGRLIGRGQICQVSTEPGFRANNMDGCRAEAAGGNEFACGMGSCFMKSSGF